MSLACLVGRHRFEPGAWMRQTVWFGGEPQRYNDPVHATGVCFDICLDCRKVVTRAVHT